MIRSETCVFHACSFVKCMKYNCFTHEILAISMLYNYYLNKAVVLSVQWFRNSTPWILNGQGYNMISLNKPDRKQTGVLLTRQRWSYHRSYMYLACSPTQSAAIEQIDLPYPVGNLTKTFLPSDRSLRAWAFSVMKVSPCFGKTMYIYVNLNNLNLPQLLLHGAKRTLRELLRMP